MCVFDFKLEYGYKNAGTVYLPDEKSINIPVIIYCHGWGSSNRKDLNPSTKAFMESVLELNMAFVAFDNFGCGETGGNYNDMTYGVWAKCAEDVFDWVAEEEFSDKNKIGFFAISSGTTVALRFAQNSNKPAFIISIATAITAHIGMNDGGPVKVMIDNLDDLLDGDTVELFGTSFKIDFYLDELKNLAVYSMDKIKCPVFFLQGAEDNIWRLTDAKLGYELMKQNNQVCKYFLVDDAGHGLDEKPKVCSQKSIEWLKDIDII